MSAIKTKLFSSTFFYRCTYYFIVNCILNAFNFVTYDIQMN